MKKFISGMLLALVGSAFSQNIGELIKYQETGLRSRRVNLTVIGDGYQASERNLFLQHLETFVDVVVNKDLPLMEYSTYFNVYGIFVASKESGADDPSKGITRDTYFNANYNKDIVRLLEIDDAKAQAIINKFVPETDLQFCIVNSATYGGSGGRIAVANYTTPEIISHEVGHTFAALGDEYENSGSRPWEAPNTTQITSRNLIRWKHWIDAATPIPTPKTSQYTNAMGLFEGAAYNPKGWYRPKQDCRMRTNGIPFCSTCAEAYILKMYDRISPIDSSYPPNASPLSMKRPAVFTVTPMRPLHYALKLQWFVDGILQPKNTGEIFSGNLTDGRHRVMVRVTDTTKVVRLDSLGLLMDSLVWTADVAGGTEVNPTWNVLPDPLTLISIQKSLVQFLLPTSGEFQLRLISSKGKVAFELRSANGVAGLNQISWQAKPGFYLVELKSGSNLVRRYFNILR
jgi:hypothetical protein